MCVNMWSPSVTDDAGYVLAIKVETARCCHSLTIPIKICFLLSAAILEALERAKIDRAVLEGYVLESYVLLRVMCERVMY